MKISMWLTKFISGAYKAVVSYIFFLILAALLFMAAFSTCFVDAAENIYYLPDNLWANLAVLFLSFAALLLAKKLRAGKLKAIFERIDNEEKFFLRIRRSILVIFCTLLCVWASCTRIIPGGDQITVLDAAYGLAQRNFDPISPVNYLFDYNHQVGLAMVEMVLNRVLGDYNFVAYHLLNAVFVTLICREFSLIAARFGMTYTQQLAVILLFILFTPLSLYISFIYGTIPGLLLALIAIRYEFKYFSDGKLTHALVSAFCIAFAAMLKSNYLIFMVAMLLYAFVEILRVKKYRRSVLIVFIAVFYLAQAKIPLYIFGQMRGAEIPKGVSTWAWVTMGLQDGRNPGWYNGYTLDTLIGSEFDTKRQEIWVKEDLKARLKELWEDKDKAREFFARKTASQWNEPSFESVTILQGRLPEDIPEWPEKLISPKGNHSLTQYLNYLNFVILAGAVLYLLFCSKSEHFHDSLIFPMIIIGGFLFHLVWEAKGQYTLPYFVLLLPYTVMGYSAAAEKLSKPISGEIKTGSALCISKKELAVKLVLLIAGLLILWYVFHGTLGSLKCDMEAYMNYLAQHS